MSDRTHQALARLREQPVTLLAGRNRIGALLTDCAEALAALYEEAWGDMTVPPSRKGEVHTRLSFGLLTDAHERVAALADAVLGPQGDADDEA